MALRALGRSRVRTATPLELTVPLTNSSAIEEMGRKEKEGLVLEREYDENEQRKRLAPPTVRSSILLYRSYVR
jgi:hypothetical protein